MSYTEETYPEGYMKASDGSLVPVAKVKPQHKLEDEMVRGLAEGAITLSETLAAFKARALGRAADFQEMLAQEYATARGGAQGNVTFKSYDGSIEMQVAVSKTLTFGPELQSAKALIDGCIARWSEGANDNIRVLVNDAFQVNKVGRIDTQRVLALRRLDIEDADWQRAMQAISDALRVHSTKTYLRFYSVDPETGVKCKARLDLSKAGVKRPIPLDLAVL